MFHLNASTLGKTYKERLSDYSRWEQKSHATEWMLMEENVGEYMSIDETSPSRGDLFTILSNKEGHGRKGTVAAMVSGTRSEDISSVFSRIPIEKRLSVKEVTMDFSDSMRSAVTASFPNADITIDCFHIIQLATGALNEIRMEHKRKAMSEEAARRREHKKRLKQYADSLKKRELKCKASGREESPRGRKPKRRNEAYVPPRLNNGDTVVELLNRSRYFLSQSREKWTDTQKRRAEILFNQYPDMLDAYNLVNKLRNIFKNKKHTTETAGNALGQWYKDVDRSGFKTLKIVADTMESRQEHIVNYFKDRHTNASAESLNSKIKGFRTMMRGVSDLPFFMYRVATVFG